MTIDGFGKQGCTIAVFDVVIRIEASDESILGRVPEAFPPYTQTIQRSVSYNAAFAIIREGGEYRVLERSILHPPLGPKVFDTLEQALEALRGQMEFCISCQARERVFVHAGAVSLEGVGIVVPGKTMGGKSTLVKAIASEGGLLYSDEFAVFDARGFLYPFPRKLCLRDNNALPLPPAWHHELGLDVGTEPVRVGLVLAVRYAKEARWEIESLSPAETVVELMRNTASARDNPGGVLRALKAACDGVVGLRGHRGETSVALEKVRGLISLQERENVQGFERHAEDRQSVRPEL